MTATLFDPLRDRQAAVARALAAREAGATLRAAAAAAGVHVATVCRWQARSPTLAGLYDAGQAAKRRRYACRPRPTRAQFLAVRRELMEGWQPRNGIERQLIDTMAQAQTAYLYWLDALTFRSSVSSARKREGDRWEPLTVEDEEALEQAAAMVERFNGIFLRTPKALRDLRRQVPGVVVQNAGQVKVG